MREPDRLAMRLLAEVPIAYRDEVASVLGQGDTIARHVPVHLLPRALLACWVTFTVIDAWEEGDRDRAAALDHIAGALVRDIGGTMAIVAGLHAEEREDKQERT